MYFARDKRWVTPELTKFQDKRSSFRNYTYLKIAVLLYFISISGVLFVLTLRQKYEYYTFI